MVLNMSLLNVFIKIRNRYGLYVTCNMRILLTMLIMVKTSNSETYQSQTNIGNFDAESVQNIVAGDVLHSNGVKNTKIGNSNVTSKPSIFHINTGEKDNEDEDSGHCSIIRGDDTHTKPLQPWIPIQEDDVQTEKDRIYYEKYNFLPPRSKSCDKVKGPGQDFTIITALIDLKREEWPHFRRLFLKYCYYAIQMLNLHAPLVIFVDESVVDFVEYHRQGKEHLTKIIPTAIRDLEYYKKYDIIRDIMKSDNFKQNHSMLKHPEGFSPEYNILMNSKLSMLFQAATKNYFSTNYFYWMDVGYGHGEDIFPTSCLWSPTAIMNNVDQITYIQLNPISYLKSIDDLYKKFLPAFLNGAFFGGPKISIKRYYFLHREVFLKFLEEGKVDDDQTLAVACHFVNPMLFNIVKGWWYDVFTLFKL